MLYLELPHLSCQIHNRFDSNHIQLDRLQRTFTHTIVRLDPRDKYSNKSWLRGVYFIHLRHLFVESNGGRTVEDHTNLRNQCPEHFLGGRSAKSVELWLLYHQASIVRKHVLLYISCSPQIFFLQWLWKTGLERDLRLDLLKNGGFKKRKTNFLSYCPYPIVLYSVLTKTLTN